MYFTNIMRGRVFGFQSVVFYFNLLILFVFISSLMMSNSKASTNSDIFIPKNKYIHEELFLEWSKINVNTHGDSSEFFINGRFNLKTPTKHMKNDINRQACLMSEAMALLELNADMFQLAIVGMQCNKLTMAYYSNRSVTS